MEYISDPKFGICVYRNQLKEEFNFVERIENAINLNKSNENLKWKMAEVGYREFMPEYRNCWDFKVNEDLSNFLKTTELNDISKIYEEIKFKLKECLQSYCYKYNLSMEFMEAINFVKYEKDQHFQVHSDHGFSYICTVSSVMYLNDNYEGGELWFPNLDIKFKPNCGDIIFFPSTYIYSHASLPVIQGVKYSAVTMFDYNDKYHKTHSP